MRCYEKGYEMLSKYKHMVRDSATHINGFRVEDIYRCEVELKAVNTDIPWEVIERRDQYFAGSYPFCADILPNIEADILQRRPQREPQTDLAIALENFGSSHKVPHQASKCLFEPCKPFASVDASVSAFDAFTGCYVRL